MVSREKRQQNTGGPELKTLEWDILNPVRLFNLEIKKKERIQQ